MAPSVGQHTEEVLAEVLGRDETEIAGLRERGVFG
jgi:crotonobetainyl-CoA:carnitine CoA-transferase CaiB-like acyl-CoA transferase